MKTCDPMGIDRETEKDRGKGNGKRLLLTSLLVVLALSQFIQPVHAQATCATNADCATFGYSCSIPVGQATGTCIPCSTSAECVQKTLEGNLSWFKIAMAAVMIAISASGILFGIGYAFNLNQVKQVGRGELLQGFASLVLVLFLFGVLETEQGLIGTIETSSGVISGGLATAAPEKFGLTPEAYRNIIAIGGTVQIDPFDVSYAFLKRLVDCMKDNYDNTLGNSKWQEVFANTRLKLAINRPPNINWAVPTELFKLISGVFSGVQRSEFLADELTWTTVLLYTQLALLKFIETSMFTVFLPIGIILRSFPPTRGAGAVLTAISIGLYVVFPMTYLILYIGTPDSLGSCNVGIPVAMLDVPATCPISPSSVTTTTAAAASKSVEAESNLIRIQTISTEARYLAWLYLLISLSIMFIFVRSAAGILGADISEIGRSMFRMI